jgi:hypothetical protein
VASESSRETVERTTARIELFTDWYDDPLAFFEVALQAKDIRKWQRALLAEIRDRRKGVRTELSF